MAVITENDTAAVESIPVARPAMMFERPEMAHQGACVPSINPRTLLDHAIERLRRGWLQNAFRDDEGSFCLTGAMHADGNVPIEIYAIIARKLGVRSDSVNEMYQAFTFWNDTPGRTKEEVIDLLTEVRAEL